MRVFVLCAGRCGSVTFAKACSEITNYTCSHESMKGKLACDRFPYSDNHIEVDNRLACFLGWLEEFHCDDFYVHLKRDIQESARSYLKGFSRYATITKHYRIGALMGKTHLDDLKVCVDYCETTTKNISVFLKHKTNKMDFDLKNASALFPEFWNRIGAGGNMQTALNHWNIMYNAGSRKK